MKPTNDNTSIELLELLDSLETESEKVEHKGNFDMTEFWKKKGLHDEDPTRDCSDFQWQKRGYYKRLNHSSTRPNPCAFVKRISSTQAVFVYRDNSPYNSQCHDVWYVLLDEIGPDTDCPFPKQRCTVTHEKSSSTFRYWFGPILTHQLARSLQNGNASPLSF